MPVLAQINPAHIDLKEMIMSSKVLDELQKTQLLVIASKLPKEELVNILNSLNDEKERISSMKQNYQRLIERYENVADEISADEKEQAEADKILERLNSF